MTSDSPTTLRYRCLDLTLLGQGEYAVIPVRREDMLPIMAWRNAQLGVLRGRAPLTETQQLAYWEQVVEPAFAEEQPDQILFTYLWRDRPIGYGGLVHLSWADRRAEVSFLVEPARAAQPDGYARDFAVWLQLVRQIAFERLGLQRLFTETYDRRDRHIAVLEAAGFVREGRLRRHVIIDGRPVDSLMHGCLNPRFAPAP